MTHYIQKPENALKRANELIGVGQESDALTVLHTVVTSRRNRTWQKIIETIMFSHIDLGVKLSKGRLVKDALHQFRVACRQVPASLEAVLAHYVRRSQEAAAEAQERSDATVGGVEGDQERADRELVTPWLKFLWEAYRTVLDILKTNEALQTMYHHTAQQAFNYCLKFKRKNEFRRLCDLLRHHFTSMQSPGRIRSYNGQEPPARINLESPETQQMHLQTKFVQLSAASELEQWQEAFKAIEDIHLLIKVSKRTPKAHLMALYYEKLSHIFWVSGSHLFHAYAYYRFYSISRKQNKSLTEEQIRPMASKLLLAALSIPLQPQQVGQQELMFEFDSQKEKNAKMAQLLGFAVNPRRDALLEELYAKNVLADVLPSVRSLHAALKVDFDPQSYEAGVKKHCDEAMADRAPGAELLSQYRPAVERLMLVRLLQQLASVYDTLAMAEVPKFAGGRTFHEIEHVVLQAAVDGHISVRIDHRNAVLNFACTELDSEDLRYQLRDFFSHIDMAVKKLRAHRAIQAEGEAEISLLTPKELASVSKREHAAIIKRRAEIEEKKEKAEAEARAKSAAAQEAAAEKKEREEREERERVEAEVARRARLAEEEREREITKREQTDWSVAVVGADEEALEAARLAAMEAEELEMGNKIEKLTRERQEMESKMFDLSKKLGFLERAIRQEEAPLIAKAAAEHEAEASEYVREQVAAGAEAHRARWKFAKEEQARLRRQAVLDAAKAERDRAGQGFKADYEKRKKARDARAAAIRKDLTTGKEHEYAAKAKAQAAKDARARQEEERIAREIALAEQREREAAERAARREPEQIRGNWEDAPADRSRVPPRDRDRDRDRDADRDREPDRRDDSRPWRGGRGDDRGPPRGDRGRGPSGREERSDVYRPPRRDYDDRGPPRRGGFDDRGGRFDDRGPPRRGGFDDRGGRFDDRGPPRRGGFDDRGPPRGGGFDDRGPPRRGGFDDRGPPRRGGFDDRGPPRRDDRDRGGGDREGKWRR